MFKKKVIPLILVLALCMSCVIPVSAAYVNGDVAPSGESRFESYEVVSLPDRDRFTFYSTAPTDNFYWCTQAYGKSTADPPIKAYTYDLSTSYFGVGGYATSTSLQYNRYAYVYPVGRYYYPVPFTDMSGNPVELYELCFYVTLGVRTRTVKYSDNVLSSTTYGSGGSVPSPMFVFDCYDIDKNYIGSTNASCARQSLTGAVSADTFEIATYKASFDLPHGTAYFVPIVRFHRMDEIVNSSQYRTFTYCDIAPVEMSFSLQTDILRDMETVDGIWEFSDRVDSGLESGEEKVNFTSGGTQYTGISYLYGSSNFAIMYNYEGGGETVYVDQWFGDSKKIIDFGSVPQEISTAFGYWLRKSAVRIGDSPGAGMGDITIKDYSGSVELFSIDSVKFPCTVAVQNNGLAFTYAGDDEVSYFYEFSGSGNFVGCSLVPNDSMTRYTEGRTFTMTSSGSIYLHIEGDVGPDQPVDPDPSEPTEPSDPTEPVDPSDPIDPTVPDDSDKSDWEDLYDNVAGIGNALIDKLKGAIPDYSEGYVLSLVGFSTAFSYEGTDCYLTLPALTMPEIPGLIPEFEIMPEMQLDAVGMLGLFPSWIVTLVQSLLTVALIVYCFKELYDTLSYVFTLNKGG